MNHKYFISYFTMNIFFLFADPDECARGYCKMHRKIILEICQMLATAYRVSGEISILEDAKCTYKPCHVNHPVSKWVRACLANFEWSCLLGLALCKVLCPTHKCKPYIEYFKDHPPTFLPQDSEQPTKKRRTSCFYLDSAEMKGCTPFPVAFSMSEDDIKTYVPDPRADPHKTIRVLYAVRKNYVYKMQGFPEEACDDGFDAPRWFLDAQREASDKKLLIE